MTMNQARRRRIPPSVIRGSIVATVLVIIIATLGIAATHLSTGVIPHPVPTSQP
jgi:hypothetical protein